MEDMPGSAPGAPCVERKLRLSGSAVEYACALVLYRPPLIVIRYVLEDGGQAFGTPVELPPGTVSLGFFWLDRPFNAYRMRAPATGELLAHRFDAVTNVAFVSGVVSYRDLVLDWWLLPGRPLVEEDRDELDAYVAAGQLASDDLRAVEQATETLTTRMDALMAELDFIESGLS